jgi:hypothetical protein
MNLILAQSTSLDGAMSEGLGIIAKFLYIIAVIVGRHHAGGVGQGLRRIFSGQGGANTPKMSAPKKANDSNLPPHWKVRM